MWNRLKDLNQEFKDIKEHKKKSKKILQTILVNNFFRIILL